MSTTTFTCPEHGDIAEYSPEDGVATCVERDEDLDLAHPAVRRAIELAGGTPPRLVHRAGLGQHGPHDTEGPSLMHLGHDHADGDLVVEHPLERHQAEQVLALLERNLVVAAAELRPGKYRVRRRATGEALGGAWFDTEVEAYAFAFGYTRALYDTGSWVPEGYAGRA